MQIPFPKTPLKWTFARVTNFYKSYQNPWDASNGPGERKMVRASVSSRMIPTRMIPSRIASWNSSISAFQPSRSSLRWSPFSDVNTGNSQSKLTKEKTRLDGDFIFTRDELRSIRFDHWDLSRFNESSWEQEEASFETFCSTRFEIFSSKVTCLEMFVSEFTYFESNFTSFNGCPITEGTVYLYVISQSLVQRWTMAIECDVRWNFHFKAFACFESNFASFNRSLITESKVYLYIISQSLIQRLIITIERYSTSDKIWLFIAGMVFASVETGYL